MTVEIFFTATKVAVAQLLSKESLDWSLQGETYIWMFFIYACIPILFRLLYGLVDKLHVFYQAVIVVLIIFIVEFITGFALDMLLGKCPWEYTEGLHVMGYIRLDYAPFWFVFAVFVIGLYKILVRKIAL